MLSKEVECDEAYVIAGHKGQPDVVKSKERQGRRRQRQGKAGRDTLAKERPPVFGMMQGDGQVVINPLANVKQKTIEPLIKDTIMPGTLLYTDEYSMYARLHVWGYDHKSVHHGRGAYAREEEGDGLCEGHVNTMEGGWSLLWNWLCPRRGIAQEKRPLSLGFFACVHHARNRGKALLPALMEFLGTEDPGIHDEPQTQPSIRRPGLSADLDLQDTKHQRVPSRDQAHLRLLAWWKAV